MELGLAMIDRIPDSHYTFVDTTLHNDCRAIFEQAVRLVGLFEKQGINRHRVIVSVGPRVIRRLRLLSSRQIPATNDGVRAARRLETELSIHTNLILVSSLTHAAICLESGASAISFCHETVSLSFLNTRERRI